MENNLLLAILSMDAYNRGNHAGINMPSMKIGPVTVVANSATNQSSYDANFSATTYLLDDGSNSYIIAYRGTDNFVSDLGSGYLSAIGGPDPQAEDAIGYYQSMLSTYLGSTASPYASGIVVTGHSLGGGLAGLVSGLYNLSSTVYDNMPFQLAAQTFHDLALASRNGNGDFVGSVLDNLIYNGHDIQDTTTNNPVTYTNPYDPLNALRDAQTSETVSEPAGQMSATEIATFGGHSMALEVALIYAADQGLTGWFDSSKYLWDAFESDDVAAHVARLDTLRAGAAATPSGAVDYAIAYSAVAPDLSDDTKPFGDTALASMFDDASDLATALDATPNSALTRAASTLASIAVTFAGDLATGDVIASASPSAARGILDVGSGAVDLAVDFTSQTWATSPDGVPADYKSQLITKSAGEGEKADDLALALGRYEANAGLSPTPEASVDGSYYLVSSVNYQTDLSLIGRPTNVTAGTVDLLFVADGSTGADTTAESTDTIRAIVAADGGQTLIGHDEDDVLVGGSGDDTLVGGGGTNVLFGGDGDDDIRASRSGNLIVGGDGSDYIQIRFSDANGGGHSMGGKVGDTIWGNRDGIDATSSSANDTVDYSDDPNSMHIDLVGSGSSLGITVDDGAGDLDDLHSIEDIKGSHGPNVISLSGEIQANTVLNIDASGATKGTIDAHAASSGVLIELNSSGSSGIASIGTGGRVGLSGSFTTLVGSSHDDIIEDLSAGGNNIDGRGGADQLDLANGDTVDSVTYGDRITFGALLSGGKRQIAADAPDSESGTYVGGGSTYEYDADAHTLVVSNASGSVTIEGFTNGDAHIVLSTKRSDDPTPHPIPQPPSPPPYLPHNPPNPRDPLVLDLAGAGITLSSLTGSTAYFDYTNSGYRQHTGWVTSGMGLLVTMPQDGQTITRSELLGAQSGSGFVDLASLDSNQDGVIDASDPGYQTLAVWIDADLDGESGAGELHTLADLGITSISVATAASDETSGGNQIVATGTFSVAGSDAQHEIAEINFATDRQNTIVPTDSTVTISAAAAALPTLVGYGALPNLRASMSLDPTLLADVHELVFDSGSLSGSDFEAAFETMIQRWAGADSIDPTSEGEYVDARHLAVVYAAFGIDPTADPTYQIQPNGFTGKMWEALYSDIVAELKVRFVSQIDASLEAAGVPDQEQIDNPYRALLSLNFDAGTDRFLGDVPSVFKFAKALEPTDPAEAAAYWQRIEPVLASLRFDVAPATLFQAAIGAHFSFDQLVGLAGDLGIPVDATDGVITMAAGFGGTTVFTATSSNHEVSADYQTVILPDYDPATTSIYRVDGTYDLAIQNIGSGSILTISGFFSPYNWWPATIELADGSTYRYDTIGELQANSAAIEIGSAIDLAMKRDLLGDLHYSVVTDPVSAVPTTGAVAYEIDGTSSLAVDADGDGTGANILFFANGSAPGDWIVSQSGSDNRDLVLTNAASGQIVTLAGQGDEQNAHIQDVVFEDGTVWSSADLWRMSETTGTATGAPLIVSHYLQDSLTAGTGDVELRSDREGTSFITGAGNDTLDVIGQANVIHVTNGTQSVEIRKAGGTLTAFEATNLLILPAGCSLSDCQASQDPDTESLILSFGEGLSIKIDYGLEYFAFGVSPVSRIQAADGTIASIGELIQKSIVTMEARGDDRVIIVNTGTDFAFTAGPGNVTLDAYSFGGHDPITLTAGSGNDILNGSASAQTTYVVTSSASTVEIDPNGYGTSDVIQFGPGIAPEDIGVMREGDGPYVFRNLITGATVTLRGIISDDQNPHYDTVGQVLFADGTVWTAADVLARIQTIEGTSGDDYLLAPDGCATVIGHGGNDTLVAGRGVDLLVGGGGRTNFVVKGQQNDVTTIRSDLFGYNEVGPSNPPFSIGQLTLTGIAAADVTATLDANGSDVDLTIAGLNQTIRLVGEATDTPVVDGIGFDGGTTWSLAEIQAKAGIPTDPTTIQGTMGDDVIEAGSGDVTVYGNGGNDTLVAGDGNDTLVGGPTGHTTFEVGAASYSYAIQARDLMPSWKDGRQSSGDLRLTGIAATDVEAAQNGQDIVLTIMGSDETITLQNELSGTPVVDSVTFDDGTVLSAQDIRNLASGSQGGPIVIQGTPGDDVLVAGQGDTTIYSNGGNDTLIAGAGNDILVGGPTGHTDFEIGAAPYSYSVEAADLMPSWKGGRQSSGTLYLSGLDPASVSAATGNGLDVVLTILGSAETITLSDELSSTPVVDSVIFDNGTVWTAQDVGNLATQPQPAAPTIVTIQGTPGDDILEAGTGETVIYGNGGNDTLISGQGSATLVGGPTGHTIFQIDAAPCSYSIEAADLMPGWKHGQQSSGELRLNGVDAEDVQVSTQFNGSDIVLFVAGTGEQIILQDEMTTTPVVSSVAFADGTTWTSQQLVTMASAPQGVDVTAGAMSSDLIIPVDSAAGSASPSYQGAIAFTDTDAGATHTIRLVSEQAFGSTSDAILNGALSQAMTFSNLTEPSVGGSGSVSASFAAPDGMFDYLSPGETVDLQYTYEIDDSDLRSTRQTIDVSVTRSFASPVITGSAAYSTDDESQIAISASDLQATATLQDPNDWVYLQDVDGAIGGSVDIDQNGDVSFTPDPTFVGTASFNYGLMDATQNVVRGTVTVEVAPHRITGTAGDDMLSGDGSPAIIDGGAGNDVLSAGANGDTLVAGPGNDVLIGGAGADTFALGDGLGNILVQNFASDGVAHDVLSVSSSLFTDWAHLLQATRQSGSDLLISTPNGSVVTLQNVAASAFTAADVRFT